MSVFLLSPLQISELIEQAAMVNFMLLLNILKISKMEFWTFCQFEHLALLALVILKWYKAFNMEKHNMETAMISKAMIKFLSKFLIQTGELKKWSKLNLRGYWSEGLVNTTIFAPLTHSFIRSLAPE